MNETFDAMVNASAAALSAFENGDGNDLAECMARLAAATADVESATMSREASEAAIIVFRENVKWSAKNDVGDFPPPFMLGMIESLGDVTTSPPFHMAADPEAHDAWLNQYDAGREIARAVFGMD